MQLNVGAHAVRVVNAADVVIRDVTLTRPAGGGRRSAIHAEGCGDLTIDEVRVLSNASQTAAIYVH